MFRSAMEDDDEVSHYRKRLEGNPKIDVQLTLKNLIDFFI